MAYAGRNILVAPRSGDLVGIFFGTTYIIYVLSFIVLATWQLLLDGRCFQILQGQMILIRIICELVFLIFNPPSQYLYH